MSSYAPLADELSDSLPFSPRNTVGGTTPSATFFSCVANLANTILGSGLLGLPGAFAGAGSLTGTLLLIIAAFGSANGLRLLSLCASKVGYDEPTSFYSVANRAHPSSTTVIDFAVAIKCFGVATSYLIIVADVMVDVMKYFNGDGSMWSERWIWVVVGTTAVTSLSFFKTLDALKFTSAIAIVFVVTLTVVIVIYSTGAINPCDPMVFEEFGDTCKGPTDLTKPFKDTLQKLSTFVFAYTCHQNIFSVCNEISNRTQSAVDRVIATSITVGLVLYLVVAWAGYETFGDNVQSDILKNYPKNALVTTMRIFVALLVIFSYPLQLDPSRRCVTTLVNKIRKGKRDDEQMKADVEGIDEEVNNIEKESLNGVNGSHSDYDSPGEGGRSRIDDLIYMVITVTFLTCSFLLAMVTDDLGIMLAFVGATGSTAVSYILPGGIYLRIFYNEGWTWGRIAAVVQVGAGGIIMPVALYYAMGGGE